MFKENKEFWLYIIGTIILFLVIIFGLRSYIGPRSFASFLAFSASTPTPMLVFEQPPEDNLKPKVDYFAVIKTNKGEFKIDLFENNAPNTVNNFVHLSTQDYYDKTIFHRLIPRVLIQGGSRNTLNDDPNDDEFGGPGYIFDDEINWDSLDFPKKLREELRAAGYSSIKKIKSKDLAKYSLVMANAGPDTNGSQFFILFAGLENEEVSKLRGKHTVFGEIVGNTELIDQLAEIPVVDPIAINPRPAEDIIIEDIEILIKDPG